MLDVVVRTARQVRDLVWRHAKPARRHRDGHLPRLNELSVFQRHTHRMDFRPLRGHLHLESVVRSAMLFVEVRFRVGNLLLAHPA